MLWPYHDEQRPLIGAFHDLGEPWLVELAADAGCDFVVIEDEHGLRDQSSLAHLILAGEAAGIPVLVRMGEVTPIRIGKVLDAGAAGFFVPHVRNAQQIETVIRWGRYGPEGRGTGFRRNGIWGIDAAEFEYRDRANTALFVAAIIEDVEGHDNIREIVRVPGLSAVNPGPLDLALSMGGLSYEHPDVQQALSDIEAAVTTSDAVKLIGACLMPEHAQEALRKGSSILLIGHETLLIARAYRSFVDGLKQVVAESASTRLG